MKKAARSDGLWSSPLRRCFLVGCLLACWSTNLYCEAFTSESILRNCKQTSSLLRSSSEDSTATVAAISETNGDASEMEDATTPTELLSSSPNEYFGRNGYSMTSGYSRFLYTQEEKPNFWTKLRRNKQKADADMNEDGYADMQQRGRNRSFFQKVLRLPFKTAKKIVSKDKREPGTLILVRHGESEWNKNKTFTGWADPGEYISIFGRDEKNLIVTNFHHRIVPLPSVHLCNEYFLRFNGTGKARSRTCSAIANGRRLPL